MIKPVHLLIALVLLSHVVMPLFNTESIGPLFIWKLYHEVVPLSYDLQIQSKDRNFFLTSGLEPDLGQNNGGFLFGAIAEYPFTDYSESNRKLKFALLNKIMSDNKIKSFHFCKFTGSYVNHVLRSDEEKRALCVPAVE